MKTRHAVIVLLLAASTALAHAQGGTVTSGCGSSLENPTAVLALIGSVAGIASVMRSRLRR